MLVGGYTISVSYTHLDVYKRQVDDSAGMDALTDQAIGVVGRDLEGDHLAVGGDTRHLGSAVTFMPTGVGAR